MIGDLIQLYANANIRVAELERENAELQATFDLMYSANQRGINAWRESHPESAMLWPDQSKLVEWLLTENAALREALLDAEELERYSGDGRRQWGKCSAWLNPNDAVVIISAKALDAARKEAQP